MRSVWLAVAVAGCSDANDVEDFVGRWQLEDGSVAVSEACTLATANRTTPVADELELVAATDADLVAVGIGWYDDACETRFDITDGIARMQPGQRCMFVDETSTSRTEGTLEYSSYVLQLDRGVLRITGSGISQVTSTGTTGTPPYGCRELLQATAVRP